MSLGKYDKNGNPLELLEWAQLLEDRDYSRVAYTEVKKDYHDFYVSTVWLGLDHNWADEGPPIIFETMVFENKLVHSKALGHDLEYHPSLDMFSRRYSTLAEAEAGHKEVVSELENILIGGSKE